MKIQCPNCKYEIEVADNANYGVVCPNCQNVINATTIASQSAGATPVPPPPAAAQYQPAQQAPQGAPSMAGQMVPQSSIKYTPIEPKKKSKAWLWALLGVLLAGGIAATVVLLLNKDDKVSEEPKPAEMAESDADFDKTLEEYREKRDALGYQELTEKKFKYVTEAKEKLGLD